MAQIIHDARTTDTATVRSGTDSHCRGMWINPGTTTVNAFWTDEELIVLKALIERHLDGNTV